MDRIKIMDEKLLQSDSYDFVMNKYLKNTLIVIMMIMMFFLMLIYKDNMLLYIGIFWLMDSLVTANINPYLYIKKDKVKLSIYSCLKETSISKKDFIKSRLKYHFTFIYKLCIGSLLMCLLGGYISKEISINKILDSIYIILIFNVLATVSVVISLYSLTKD